MAQLPARPATDPEGVLAAAATAAGDAAPFVERYLRHVDATALRGRSAEDLVAMAASHREVAATRAPGQTVVDASDGEDLATGRFVLLHDPSEPEPWGGAWRVVPFARAELEPEVAGDPMLGAVGWSWLTDALQAHGITPGNLAGTVTRVVSESFADLEEREPDVEMEIRASWTPADSAVGVHLQAWVDMLGTVGGLPPLPAGVTALPGRRR